MTAINSDQRLCVFLDRPLTKAEAYKILEQNKGWIEAVVKMDPTNVLHYESMDEFNTTCDELIFGQDTCLTIGWHNGLDHEFIGYSGGSILVQVCGDIDPEQMFEEFEGGEFDTKWIDNLQIQAGLKSLNHPIVLKATTTNGCAYFSIDPDQGSDTLWSIQGSDEGL